MSAKNSKKSKAGSQKEERSASNPEVDQNQGAITAPEEVKVSTPDPFAAVNAAVGEAYGAPGNFAFSIFDAWVLVEAGTAGLTVPAPAIHFAMGRLPGGQYYAKFYGCDDSDAETAPLAICKAFLKFKGITL